MKILFTPAARHGCTRTLLLSCSLIGITGASIHAQAQTQIAQDRARLGNSTPLIQQIDPATVRDSERAQADTEEQAAVAAGGEDR
ncbi:carbohydrate porin, partial [Komagataeibacter sp. FXV3]|nr:carbohydrate porin [Komagataeibacter sp. FXV3]